MAARIIRFGIVAAIAAAFLFSPVAESADMRAAKKEGKVVWYTAMSTNVSKKVCALFNSKKMGITCVFHRDGSGKLYRRYLQEAKGSIYTADVFHTSNLGHFLNLKKKHLIKYVPKGTENFNPKFKTDHGYWTMYRASMLVPFYNTKKVKADEVPKSWKGFLDPKWKGRMAHSHPSYSGFVTNGMINLVNMFGWGYYEKMAKQKPKILQSALAGIPLVARGELDVGHGAPLYGLFNAIKKGEPLKVIIPKEGVALITSPSGVLKKAPHPNAAKVFSDFIFSQEAMQLLVDQHLHVGHPGVKYPAGVPSLDSMKLLSIGGEELKKKNKPTRTKFRKLFGV
jgi:iron(III) transport system substrate-binding protein